MWLVLAWGLFLASPLSAEDKKPRTSFEGHTEMVRCVAFSPDGKTLASGSFDNTIRFWDVASGKEQTTLKDAAVFGVESVAFSPNGKILASGAGGNTIKLWDISTQKATTLLDEESEYAVPLVVFSPDGKTLASGGQCISNIRLWDVTTRKRAATLPGRDEYGIRTLAFLPGGKTLGSVARKDGIKLFDVATGKTTATRKLEADYIPSAAFSPNGKTLAMVRPAISGGEGARDVLKDAECIKLIEVATGKEQATINKNTASRRPIVFSPDGKTLAWGSDDGTITVWDVAKAKELASFKGHSREVSCLAFSPDSKILVSGSADTNIKLWDVAPRK
jgi:WD40 repeat protein